jgi:hypothetical protein
MLLIIETPFISGPPSGQVGNERPFHIFREQRAREFILLGPRAAGRAGGSTLVLYRIGCLLNLSEPNQLEPPIFTNRTPP